MFYDWLKKINEADESAWPAMLNSIAPSSMRGEIGRHHNDDHTVRVIGADFLDDLGRGEEAARLRDNSKHVYRSGGEVHDAHEISQMMHFLRARDRGYYNGLSSDQIKYLETALWSENDEDGIPLDRGHNINDIAPSTVAAMATDWESFKDHAVSLGILGDDDEDRAPADFWLSRNGHGSGFFDSPDYYGKQQSDALQALAKRYGEYNLLIGNDGMIHGYNYTVSPPPKPPKKRRKK